MNRDAQKYDWQPADKLDISLHGRKDTFGDFSIVGAVPSPLSASEPPTTMKSRHTPVASAANSDSGFLEGRLTQAASIPHDMPKTHSRH